MTRTAMVKVTAENAHEYAGKTILYGSGDTYQEGEVIGCNPGIDTGDGGAVVIGLPANQGWRLDMYDDNVLFPQAAKYVRAMYAESTIVTVIEK